MNFVLSFHLFLSVVLIIVTSQENINISRRIGGRKLSAQEYPPYVVGVGYLWLSHYTVLCMGTLINQRYVLTAKNCFRAGLKPNDLGAVHGNIYFSKSKHYNVHELHQHKTADLAVLEIDPINVPANALPKLGSEKCSSEARAIYYSWGGNDVSKASNDLRYSNSDVALVCDSGKICFKTVDGTKAKPKDLGAGMIVGYGPGPIFNLANHEIRIIGVLSDASDSGSTLKAEEIFKHLKWIKETMFEMI